MELAEQLRLLRTMADNVKRVAEMKKENRRLTRLLTSATQCLNALCDGDALTDDTRLLSRELNAWLEGAMPF